MLAAKLGLQRVYPERDTNSGMVRVLADFKFKKQVATVAIDAALVVIAYYSAYVLRFEGALDANLPMFAGSLLIVLPCHALMLGVFRTYQDSWRHAGLRDLLSLLGAVTAGVALSVLVVLASYRFAELFARRLRDPLAAPDHLPDRQPGAVPRPRRAVPRRTAQRPAHDHLRRRRGRASWSCVRRSRIAPSTGR